MIEKAKIERLVEEHISGTGLFLVAVKISAAGKITVLADRKEGITIDECVAISRLIEKTFDRDKEDYELQVSSPGLEMPFLVKQQYYKNEGKRIEVTDTDGMKYFGILKNVTDGGFELEPEVKSKNKGKSKSTGSEELSFNYDQVKSAREVVTFK